MKKPSRFRGTTLASNWLVLSALLHLLFPVAKSVTPSFRHSFTHHTRPTNALKTLRNILQSLRQTSATAALQYPHTHRARRNSCSTRRKAGRTTLRGSKSAHLAYCARPPFKHPAECYHHRLSTAPPSSSRRAPRGHPQ